MKTGEHQHKRLLGVFLILIYSICNGTIPAITQKGFQVGLSVETILFVRYILGTTLIWCYIFLGRFNVKIGRGNILYLMLIGLSLFLATSSMNESYKYMPGTIAMLLVFSYVIIVIVIEIFLGREKLERARIVCLILTLLGLVAVIWTPGESDLNILGIVFAFIAAIFFALNVVGMGAKRISEISAVVISGYMAIVSAFLNILRCVFSGQPLIPQEPSQWIYVLILGFGAAFIAPICYCQAIKLIGGSDTAIAASMEPVVAYIAGILIMSDKISLSASLGGLLIVSAIVLLNLAKRKQEQGVIPPNKD